MFDLSSLKESNEHITVDSIKVIKKFLSYSELKPLALFIRDDLSNQVEQDRFKEVHLLKENDFRGLKGQKFHKGAIAFFEKPNFNPIAELEGPFAILNGVTSPENVGSIVRTLAGLSFKSLIIDELSCSPYLRRAIRVSMGNVVFLKIIRVGSLEKFLKESPHPIFATANTPKAMNLYEWEPSKNCGFIIGSEGHGISNELFGLCQETIKIPIKESVEHLNAANACAITASWVHYKLLNR